MLENEWSCLSRVTGCTGTAFRLKDAFSKQFLFVIPVWIVTVDTSHLAVRDRVMVGQCELPLDVEVALQAGNRISLRVVDQVRTAAFLGVQASRSMAGFTSATETGFIVYYQAGVTRCQEISAESVMTKHAVFTSHEFCTLRLGYHHNRTVNGFAGYKTD